MRHKVWVESRLASKVPLDFFSYIEVPESSWAMVAEGTKMVTEWFVDTAVDRCGSRFCLQTTVGWGWNGPYAGRSVFTVGLEHLCPWGLQAFFLAMSMAWFCCHFSYQVSSFFLDIPWFGFPGNQQSWPLKLRRFVSWSLPSNIRFGFWVAMGLRVMAMLKHVETQRPASVLCGSFWLLKWWCRQQAIWIDVSKIAAGHNFMFFLLQIIEGEMVSSRVPMLLAILIANECCSLDAIAFSASHWIGAHLFPSTGTHTHMQTERTLTSNNLLCPSDVVILWKYAKFAGHFHDPRLLRRGGLCEYSKDSSTCHHLSLTP